MPLDPIDPIRAIAITGCGVIAPNASSFAEFSERYVVSDRSGNGHGSGNNRARMDHFAPERYFGPRGFKYLTPATQYGVAAASMALDAAGLSDGPYAADERGVVVGTNFAVWSVLAAMDDTILSQGAQYLRPMEAANFSVNIPASYLSMKYGFNAFNITLTSARVAGLDALILGADCIRRGRARVVLICATEGQPPAALAPYFSAPLADGSACAVILEDALVARARGATIYGELRHGSSSFLGTDEHGGLRDPDASAAALRRAVARLATPATATVHVFESGNGCPVNLAVQQLVRAELARSGRRVVGHDLTIAFGECASVSPLLQVLAFCSSPVAAGVIVAASPQGHVTMVAGTHEG